ncbi:MAG: LysM peptidoglycan-binding domain-containing protein [Psychroserpens sp.]|nr:LysM peptidoglycan-binding domain-containing protein [Psychroserpens sp.]
MSNYLKIIVLFLLFIQVSYAQEPLLEHIIQKGENVYRISLKYNVSMDEIFRSNPGSEDVIRVGEILYIPNTSSLERSSKPNNSDRYVVSKGETKYGISKSFGISISELEDANPFIKNGLQAGHILRIPINQTNRSSVGKTDQFHTVQKGETLFGISKRYNISLSELIAINKDELGEYLQIGQILTLSNQEFSQYDENTYLVKKGDTKYGLSKKFGMSISRLEQLNPEIRDMLRTGTLLTLENSEDKNSSPTVAQNTSDTSANSNSSDNLYVIKPKETLYGIAKKNGMSMEELVALNPKLGDQVLAGDTIVLTKTEIKPISNGLEVKKFAHNLSAEIIWNETPIQNDVNNNFYRDYNEGLKLAIARAKSEYPDLKLKFREINEGSDLNQDPFETDAITFQIKPNPNFIDENWKNPSLVTITEFKNDNRNSIVIDALPSKDEMRRKVIHYLKNQGGNIICLYNADHDQQVDILKEEIPETRLIKLSSKNRFKPKVLEETLANDIDNYVIIESDQVGVFLNTSGILLRNSSSYNIKLVVLNPDYIPDSSKISYNRFKVLNLIYPKPYNPNYIKDDTKSSNISYLICSDILNRLGSTGHLNTFKDGTSTSFLGTSFKYEFNENSAKNMAVSIYMFTDESNSFLIETY